jgi:hypothetical protein
MSRNPQSRSGNTRTSNITTTTASAELLLR